MRSSATDGIMLPGRDRLLVAERSALPSAVALGGLIPFRRAAFVAGGVPVTLRRSLSFGNVTISIGNVTIEIGSPFVWALPLLDLCSPKTERDGDHKQHFTAAVQPHLLGNVSVRTTFFCKYIITTSINIFDKQKERKLAFFFMSFNCY